MDYFSLGDNISVGDLNGIVYLLRKFKRLTTDLRLGESTISSDYGSFHVSGGLTSVGGNFIIESPVNITSSDVLLNCFYSFVFTVVDVNFSGTVNKRSVTVTGDTGDNGVLNVTLPTDLIESDEQILPDFTLDIVFDPHEYYTPISSLNVELEVDKTYIIKDEVATITATVTDDGGDAVSGISVGFDVNGVVSTDTTDSDGVASLEYTGLGNVGKVTVTVLGESLVFYDGVVVAEYTGSRIQLGYPIVEWLKSNGSVVIDWGDDTQDTVNNPTTSLTHTYASSGDYTITFIGDVTGLGDDCFARCTGLTSISIPDRVTSLGNYCFYECTGLTSITIPDSVTSLGYGCFGRCTGLTSVSIPDSVTSIGDMCFYKCTALIDYQLYWTIPPQNWDNYTMPNNTNTIYTIPEDTTTNYVNKNYPSNKLDERGSGLITTITTLTGSSSITIGDTLSLSGTLKDRENNAIGSASIKIYQGDTLLDTVTTDSNGAYTKSVTGLSIGGYTFKAVYNGDETYKNSESSTLNVTVEDYPVVLTTSGDVTMTYFDDSTLVATVTKNGSPYGVGEYVTFNIDGTSYNRQINNEGKATFNLYLINVGTYTVTSTFSTASASNTVVISKASSTTSLSASSSSILTTDSLTLSGRVTSNNVGNASVKIYDGATLVDTVTSSSGVYTKTLTGLSAGTHTYKAVYDGDSNHNGSESSTVQVTVSEPTPTHDYALALTGTSIIQTGDSDTITATVTDNGSAVEGVTLDYEIKHGSTTISTGTTSATDNTGKATISYTGTGVGDVDVIVSNSSMLLQETYVVEDCVFYDPCTSNAKASYWTIPSGVTSTYDSDGWKVTANAYKQVKLTDKLTSSSSVEFTLTDYSNNNPAAVIIYAYTNGETTPNQAILMGGSSSSNNRKVFNTQLDHDLIKNTPYRIEYTSSTIKVYENDTLLGQASSSVGLPTRFEFHTSTDRYAVYKDIKVKAL